MFTVHIVLDDGREVEREFAHLPTVGEVDDLMVEFGEEGVDNITCGNVIDDEILVWVSGDGWTEE